MKKPTIVFILNPVAGGGGKRLSKKHIRSSWQDHHVIILDELEGRNDYIKYLMGLGVRDFVVAGGDGTVNEVAAVLMNTSARMGIIPSGSGNGLARDLGLPLDSEKAMEVIRQKKVRTIDVGLLNDRPFFCTAGIGFDALCAFDFATKKHSRGLWNYVKIIFGNYFSYKPVSVVVDGKRSSYFSITFANAGQFGNNAYIAPDARPDDGWLDCAMILPHPRYRFAELGWRLVRKTLGNFHYFRTSRFKSGSFMDISDRRVHIDGESVTLDTSSVEVKIVEKALNVITV
ncbi:MAG: diacylglycerol kinase [Leadbetterella sp.]|nr:diacylglycerol kinase [Leadbetterella sp.]